MNMLRPFIWGVLACVSLTRIQGADEPVAVANNNLTAMGWPAPLENDECWGKLPVPKSGQGQPLPTWARMLAREMPKTTAAFLELDRAQRTAGPVPAKLRAAMRWVSAQANRCDYAMESARGDGTAAGMSETEWAGLESGTYSGWSANDQAALRFAHAMAVDSAGFIDEDFASLVAAFNERIVGSMVLHMAFKTAC
jgi:alkylhydroperoxidase family enzyme